ncbi:hypothetical protein GTP81_08290 [Rugamonas sp. FT107W]|uniref:Uncharacterized protein n=1 Tax=Duganella vulcania TaxID=2692166 RepID=A0A845HD60_9BURK|nr:hypothetical protein [Duganella vulcania]MYN16750.1 hypothetical protein [Duganella vulcania]
MSSVNVQNVTVHNHSEITANGDWALVELVTQANASDIEVGIVLNFSGVLLEGTLVGGARYFAEMKRQISASEMTGTPLHSSLIDIAEKGESTYNAIIAGGGTRPPEYLHLISAHFVSASGEVGSTVLSSWRGKISDVSGFHLHIGKAPSASHALTASRVRPGES